MSGGAFGGLQHFSKLGIVTLTIFASAYSIMIETMPNLKYLSATDEIGFSFVKLCKREGTDTLFTRPLRGLPRSNENCQDWFDFRRSKRIRKREWRAWLGDSSDSRRYLECLNLGNTCGSDDWQNRDWFHPSKMERQSVGRVKSWWSVENDRGATSPRTKTPDFVSHLGAQPIRTWPSWNRIMLRRAALEFLTNEADSLRGLRLWIRWNCRSIASYHS